MVKIYKLPDDEEFVAMVNHKERIIVCSTKKVYEVLDGAIIPMPIVFEEQEK